MNTVKIGGREIPLYYSTYEMIAIQEEVGCTAFQLRDMVFGLHLEDEDNPNSWRLEVATDPERTKKFAKLFKILGNAGLEENGEAADLTEKWIMRNMKPAMILGYAFAVMAVINKGNDIEAAMKEDSGPVDEVLEEENAKKAQGN